MTSTTVTSHTSALETINCNIERCLSRFYMQNFPLAPVMGHRCVEMPILRRDEYALETKTLHGRLVFFMRRIPTTVGTKTSWKSSKTGLFHEAYIHRLLQHKRSRHDHTRCFVLVLQTNATLWRGGSILLKLKDPWVTGADPLCKLLRFRILCLGVRFTRLRLLTGMPPATTRRQRLETVSMTTTRPGGKNCPTSRCDGRSSNGNGFKCGSDRSKNRYAAS